MKMDSGLRDAPAQCDLLTTITPPTRRRTCSPKRPAGELLAFAGAVREAKLIILSETLLRPLLLTAGAAGVRIIHGSSPSPEEGTAVTNSSSTDSVTRPGVMRP